MEFYSTEHILNRVLYIVHMVAEKIFLLELCNSFISDLGVIFLNR